MASLGDPVTPGTLTKNMNEIELVRQAQSGDIQAYSGLVDLYKERAIRVAYSLVGNLEDAKDLSQDAFVKAFDSLQSFKADSRFYTWFYRILSNTCKDFLRKKKVRGAILFWTPKEDEEAEAPEARIRDKSKNASEALLNDELSSELYRAIEKLPFQQKSAFCLRYLDGMSLEEVAQSMELSVGAVKAHIWQAVDKMKKNLGPYLQEGVM